MYRDNVYVQCIEWCLIYKTCNPFVESHDQFMYVSLLLYVSEQNQAQHYEFDPPRAMRSSSRDQQRTERVHAQVKPWNEEKFYVFTANV